MVCIRHVSVYLQILEDAKGGVVGVDNGRIRVWVGYPQRRRKRFDHICRCRPALRHMGQHQKHDVRHNKKCKDMEKHIHRRY